MIKEEDEAAICATPTQICNVVENLSTDKMFKYFQTKRFLWDDQNQIGEFWSWQV